MTIPHTLCPDCGAKMVPRNSKHGKFWGCPNYPKCTGTRDSMGMSREDREKENEVYRGSKFVERISGEWKD